MASNGETVIALDRQRMDAMCHGDASALSALLADDLVYTHSSARLDTKQSLIGGMGAGTTVYTSIELSDVKALDLGSAVVVAGSAIIHVTAGGKPLTLDLRFTDVWANRDGRWQMVAWQSTRRPD